MKEIGEFAAVVLMGLGMALIVARQVIVDLRACNGEETESEANRVQNEIGENDFV